MPAAQPHSWLAAPRSRGAMALAMLAITVFMVWLVQPIPLRYISWAHYDETLFLRLAQHLVRGEWLGPYDRVTLVKGVGFPLWLAGAHLLQLPVMLAAALTQAFAAAVAYHALQPLITSRAARLAAFAALALCPTGLSEFNLMRELIFPALTLLAVATTLGWLLRLGTPRGWWWSAASGLALALFALTREDALVMMPLLLAVVVTLALHARLRWRTSGARPAALQAALAAALLLLPMLCVATLNWRHYGVFTLLEMNTRPFTSAYGALARVRHVANTLPQVPIPRETWTRAAAVSPAFAEAERHLKGEIGTVALGPGVSNVGPLFEVNDAIREWLSKEIDYAIPKPAPGMGKRWFIDSYANDLRFKRHFERYVGGPAMARAFLSDAMDHEIAAMRFVWILRESAAAAGHHRSARDAARYYQRVADEINAACASGRLDCRSERHTLAPPFTREHRRLMPWALGVAAGAALTLETHTTVARMGALGTPEELKAAEAFTHQRITPANAAVPPVRGYEALIGLWRLVLPIAAAAALAVWLWCAPRALRPGRCDAATATPRTLWWMATLLLVLVLMRLALMAVVHVSSWPAATTVRYLSAAHPLLVVFIACAATLGWQRWKARGSPGA